MPSSPYVACYLTTNGFRVVGEPLFSNQSMPSLTRSNFNTYLPGVFGATISMGTLDLCPGLHRFREPRARVIALQQ